MSETKPVPTLASLSIIIPTRNGAATLPSVLTMLRRQTIPFSELLVVDTESEDTTCDIAENFGAKLYSVSKEEFDHGGTRSWLAREASGDILVFFTQDAVPVTVDALEKLIAPFKTDNDISVTYGRQLPFKEANSSASHLRSFNYPAEASVRCFEDREKLGLKTIFVSNSFAAYRKSSLASVGYFKNGLIFGEDTCTVGRMLKEGMKIAYAAEAMVYHSHNYSWKQDLKRAFDIGVLHSKENWLLETYGKAEKVGLGYIRSQIVGLKKAGGAFALIDFLGRNACKFLGYRFGRHYRMLPGRLISCMSMHRSWWTGKK
jgi:polysaccharide biosynthesis protein PslC